ncbi:MAG: ABC transporter substrate-binding protein [Nitratireductor sp.]
MYIFYVTGMIKVLSFFIYACFFSTHSNAAELRILTSFPPFVTDTFVGLFEKSNNDIQTQVLNKNTIAAIDEILRGNKRKFNIFWSSSPEAFELLKQNNAIATKDICGKDGPDSVVPFAVSSVGWARRLDSELFMPAEWNDLLKPLYRGKIAMARPARSGSTHLIVEHLLLIRGWKDGWAYLLELSANLSTLTARSFGVPDGLINNRFDIGLTIDFLSQAKSDRLQFRYGRPLMLVPAQIGILRGGVGIKSACEFLRMMLSRQGQLELLAPNISRIPIDQAVRAEAAKELPGDIKAALRLSWLNYDASITSSRYWGVNTLFDIMITETLNERRALWRRYHDLNGKVFDADLYNIKQILSEVPISETEAVAASDINQIGLRSSVLTSQSVLERNLINEWRSRVKKQMQQADGALSLLEQLRDR